MIFVSGVHEGTPKEIRETAKTAAGITKKFYFSYYSGKDKAIAYKLKNGVILVFVIASASLHEICSKCVLH